MVTLMPSKLQTLLIPCISTILLFLLLAACNNIKYTSSDNIESRDYTESLTIYEKTPSPVNVSELKNELTPVEFEESPFTSTY